MGAVPVRPGPAPKLRVHPGGTTPGPSLPVQHPQPPPPNPSPSPWCAWRRGGQSPQRAGLEMLDGTPYWTQALGGGGGRTPERAGMSHIEQYDSEQHSGPPAGADHELRLLPQNAGRPALPRVLTCFAPHFTWRGSSRSITPRGEGAFPRPGQGGGAGAGRPGAGAPGSGGRAMSRVTVVVDNLVKFASPCSAARPQPVAGHEGLTSSTTRAWAGPCCPTWSP